jgi:hypothetical protein
MAKAKKTENNSVLINCPGCGHLHSLDLNRWTWNGSEEEPTFTPSLLVSWDKTVQGVIEPVCHSFITNGKIQFLSDSKHHLSGQTVDLPDFNEE